MKNLLKILIFIAVISSVSNRLMAQWIQTSGPEGGPATCFAISGTNIFAGTQGGGVFLSTNNGTRWTAVNNGLTHTQVSALAVSSTNLFAGTGGGVFLSTDNGTSWTAVNNGLTNTQISALAVSGTNIFAGTQGDGVFLSTNNGTSWTAANNGLTNTYVYALAVSGTNIFAGTDGGVFLSTNNGTSWVAASSGLTNTTVRALAISGTNIFAGTWGGGVFRSTNNGTSWTEVNNGLWSTLVSAFAVSGTNLFAGVFGGVFLSPDSGTSWTAVNNGLISPVRSLAVSGTTLFAGTQYGVFHSTNNGTNWSAVNTGLTSTWVPSLAISGTNLFAGTQGTGVCRSTNNGTSWSAVNTGLTNLNIFSLAVSGTNLFAGTIGGFTGTHCGVFLSTNNGTTWTATAFNDTIVLTLAVSGTNLFAGTQGRGVFRSTNNGASWTAVNNGLTDSTIRALAILDTYIFAGTESGVFRSTNNGASWTGINNGLTNTNVTSFAVSGTNLFAGTRGGGVFLSTNHGTSWTATGWITGSLGSVSALAVSGTNLFAGAGFRGVFLSTDMGTSWTAVNTGFSPLTDIESFAVSDTVLFAGAGGNGVWRRLLSEIITNDPPVFTSTLPDTGFMEDTILEFPLSVWFDYVEDIENPDPTLVWSIEDNDSVSTVISSDIVTFSSPFNWYGIDTLSVIVSDGESSDTAALVVTVNPVNDAPVVLEIPPIIFFEDSSHIFDLDTLVIDVDHDTTDISWFAGFPTNIIANIQQQLDKRMVQKTRQILEGDRKESKNIDDERENKTEIKTGKIFEQRSNLNIEPMKNLQSEAITESKEEQTELKVIREKKKFFSDDTKERLHVPLISVKFPESTNSPGVSVLSITQEDNDSLTITIDSLTHLVTITATQNFYGLDIPVIFTAVDDSGASDSDTTKISVLPVNDPPLISQLPELTFNEDDTLIYSISNWFPFVDDIETPDPQLIYLVTSGNNVVAAALVESYAFYGLEDWFGRDTLELMVKDSEDSASADLFVTVHPVNDSPVVLPIPAIVFPEDSSYGFDLDSYVSDVDNDTSEIDWRAEFPSDVLSVINKQVTSVGNASGIEYRKVNTDEKGSKGSHSGNSIGLQIIDRKKTIATNKSRKEGIRSARQILSRLFSSSSEGEQVNQVLGIRMGMNDSLMIEIDSLTHLATISATPNFNGLDIPVMFIATDDSLASDSTQTTISVTPVNDAPIISSPLPELTFDEDDTLDYPISNWFPFVNDLETPVGELSYFVLPGNHVMSSPGNAVFFFHAEENWFGRDTLQLVVSDSVLSDTASIYVTTFPINDPPIIGDNFPYLIEFQSDSSFVFDLDTVVVDIDDPVEALDWSVLGVSEVRVDIDPSTHECSISLPSNRNIVIDTVLFVVGDTSFAADTSDYVIVRVEITALDHFLGELPKSFSLSQNYPNPFNPVTHIRFGIPVASDVKIDVYNILGQNVISLVDERKEPGYHMVEFNGNSLGSGLYIYRIQAGSFVDAEKMILMK